MRTRIFVLFLVLLSCRSETNKAVKNKTTSVEKENNVATTNASQKDTSDASLMGHHLEDSIAISGDFVLFLRPDSIRFESYANEDENIYDADSDFGFGIAATTDSISGNKKYKTIHTGVSDKRYITIEDCKNCPQIIDRDTISYGLIMTSKGREVRIQRNLHSGDYLEDVDEYFNVNEANIINRKH